MWRAGVPQSRLLSVIANNCRFPDVFTSRQLHISSLCFFFFLRVRKIYESSKARLNSRFTRRSSPTLYCLLRVRVPFLESADSDRSDFIEIIVGLVEEYETSSIPGYIELYLENTFSFQVRILRCRKVCDSSAFSKYSRFFSAFRSFFSRVNFLLTFGLFKHEIQSHNYLVNNSSAISKFVE